MHNQVKNCKAGKGAKQKQDEYFRIHSFKLLQGLAQLKIAKSS